MTWILLSAAWLTAGCSAVDEDRSYCPTDDTQYQMEYELKLVTNMTTELKTELTTITELSVANALQTHLGDIFSDFAHDIDLSFYDTEGLMNSLYHKRDIINANQTSYSLSLPMRKYMHLGVANIIQNNVIELKGEEYSNTSMLLQADGDVLNSHTTGLFTARQPMEVLSGVDQTFNVHLYMANSAVALVLNPKGHEYTDMKVYGTGFAKQFNIKDSVYVFPEQSQLIIADKVDIDNDLLCYCSVNFPSHDAKTRAEAEETEEEKETLWQLKVYLTKTDGTITETVLDIKEPLKAGDLKIIKGELDDQGAVRPYDSTVGISITLDWHEGSIYDPDL